MREEDIVRLAHRLIDENPRIQRIETDISTLKVETHRHGILMESIQTDVRKVVEVVMHMNLRLDQLTTVRAVVGRHADRLDAVEHTLKRHMKNRKTHRSVESR